MKIINQLESSIALKLLLVFSAIVLVALFSFVLNLSALNKMRSTHQQLTQEALPLLSISQNLSKSVSEYLTVLERITDKKTNSLSLTHKIKNHEKDINAQLLALNKITHAQTNNDSIIQIIQNSNELQTLTLTKTQYIKSIDSAIKNIRMSIKSIRKKISRFTITSDRTNQRTSKANKLIQSKLIHIDEVLVQYDYTISDDELRKLKLQYTAYVKEITQHLLEIKDDDLKKTVAQYMSTIFEHLIDKEGFFSLSRSLNQNQDRIIQIIQNNKIKVKEVNSVLSALIFETSKKAENKLEDFDIIIRHNIQFTVALIILTTLLSGIVIYFYIMPRIIRRLTQLAENTKLVSSRQYDITIDVSGTDEIATMAQALNGFKLALKEKETIDRLIHDREIRLQNFVNFSVDGLVTFNDKGEIEAFNPACEKLFGYCSTEVLGKNIELLLPEFTRHDHYIHFRNVKFSDHIKFVANPSEALGARKDGALFPIEISISKITLDEEILFSCVVRNILDRKIASEERERLIEKLSRSNQELARYAFVCSHDLQEPLRMIRSFSEKLQAHLGDQFKNDMKGKKYFNFIINGAELAQDLIAGILDYSSIDGDTKAPETFSGNKILAMIQKSIVLDFDERKDQITYDNLPQLYGNKIQLFQLFNNIVSNGLKFQDTSTKPHVHVSYKDIGDFWQFSVQDNGIGMNECYFQKIFDVFQRLNHRTQYAGTGIGLAICKKIVENHGGKIWVESKINVGTTFYFTLLKPINKVS